MLDWRAAASAIWASPRATSSGRCAAGPIASAQGADRRRAPGRAARQLARGAPSAPRAARRSSTTTSSTTTSCSRRDLRAGHRGARLGDGDHRRSAHGPRDRARLLDRGRTIRPCSRWRVFGPTHLPGNLSRMRVRRALVAGHRSRRGEHPLLLRVRALQARGRRAAALQALGRRAHEGRALRYMLESVRSRHDDGARRRRQEAHRPPGGVITRITRGSTAARAARPALPPGVVVQPRARRP